jgi:hypothetical protein
VPGGIALVWVSLAHPTSSLLLEHAVRFDTAAHAAAYFTVYTTNGGCDGVASSRLTPLKAARLGNQSAAQIYTDGSRQTSIATVIIRSGSILLTLTMDAADSSTLEHIATTAASVAQRG